MIQEYLFLSDEKLEEVKKYHVQDAITECKQIKDTDCWIVSVTIKGDNSTAAKALSEANDYILSSYKPIVLTSGCASYFTKRLYPLAADFERGLRKLLYLKSAISNSQEAQRHIKDLESKNLDSIRKLLFYDTHFTKEVQKEVNSRADSYEKAEIIKLIEAIDEKSVWTVLFPDDPPEQLKQQFSKLMEYRNDIMHSHNISFERYENEKALFEEKNKEIYAAIDDLLAKEIDDENAQEFDQSLGEAIQAQKEQYEKTSLANIALLTHYMSSPAFEAARKAVINTDFKKLSAELAAVMKYNKLYETTQSSEYQKVVNNISQTLEKLSAISSNSSIQRAIDQLSILNEMDDSSNEDPASSEETEGEQA